MIIIVEGIDRVGKTTLCNKLSEEFGIPTHKYKGIISYDNMLNSEESDKTLGLFQLIKETGSDIIFDRSYFTDYVYGTIERNYDFEQAIRNFYLIDETISKMDDVFLIYLLPVDIKWSSRKHGKDLSKHDELFYKKFKDSKIKNKYRCTLYTLNEAVNFIKAMRGKENEKHTSSIDN